MSLSARRAWIEIIIILYAFVGVLVALRKESVDRNLLVKILVKSHGKSLSARRAWIEISALLAIHAESRESLSARRAWIEILIYNNRCQGERSLSARRAWIEIAPRRRVSGRTLSLSARRAWIEIFASPFSIFWICRRSPQGERG